MGNWLFRRSQPRKPGPPPHTIADGAARAAFEVELFRGARTVRVPPEKSVLEALEAAGLTPPFRCRSGICGTCETRVLSGTVEHHDTYLDDPQRVSGQAMMICVSRAPANTRVVLDL
ncbi:2Fe-2S iron-sulfur cluster-binding protein [Nocardia sp. NBC_01499]|uniref:2Fe-2S iron-sulfur cluster-binding protein n=1 Tax=Nocardia sp. NBC_01499 TaxID=2903597 RepID=UPI003867330D